MVAQTDQRYKHRQRTRSAALVADLQPVVRRALKAQDSQFVFPELTGAEAAMLMEATGIITPTGKLKAPYR